MHAFTQVAAKTPGAKILYVSYVPADAGADSTKRSSIHSRSSSRSTANGHHSRTSSSSSTSSSASTEGARLCEELYAAVAGFLVAHEEYAYVWAARSCLPGSGSAVAPGGVNFLNHVNPTALLVSVLLTSILSSHYSILQAYDKHSFRLGFVLQ
jgi:hypothetical protein